MVLFRSPSDRKQIDILAERILAKDRRNFMEVYAKETEKPFGYLLIDNQPKTTSDKQVVADVFGNCQSYPHVTTGTKAAFEKLSHVTLYARTIQRPMEICQWWRKVSLP